MGTGERLRRLLEIIPRVADRDEVPIAELAREVGTTPADLLLDLEQLAERYDTPAGFVDGVHVMIDGDRVSVRTYHFRRPMRLTVAELCALELVLSLLLHDGSEAQHQAREALRRKLAELITRLPQDESYYELRGGARGGVPRRRRCRCCARRCASGGWCCSTTRVLEESPVVRAVHPWRLIFSNGAWYLAGWCEESGGVRIYRTDRIVSAVVTDRESRPADEKVLDGLMVDGRPFHLGAGSATLTVRYSPAIARWIAEREGGTPEPDGSLVVRYPLADREWAVRHVLQYGPDAVVEEPVEVREAVRGRVERLLFRALPAGHDSRAASAESPRPAETESLDLRPSAGDNTI